MTVFSELEKRMSIYAEIKPRGYKSDVITNNRISLLDIRDYFMINGQILEEDKECGIYIAKVCAGIKNKNPAVIAVKLIAGEIYISAYAKEGLFYQHTAEKVVNEFKQYFQ